MTLRLPPPFPQFEFAWVSLATGKFVKSAYDYFVALDRTVRAIVGQGNGVAFADLPDAALHAGEIVFVVDGRKGSEAAGAGTGNLAFSDGTNWIAVDSGAAVAA